MDPAGFQRYNYQPNPMTTTAVQSPSLPAPSRYITNIESSSAFSINANPDEDWTKISDLAERRRIQNRIAQRNYRRKLKLRQEEDLHRKSGSQSASPEPAQIEIAAAQQPKPRDQKSQSPKVNRTSSRKRKTSAPASNNTTNLIPAQGPIPLQQHESYGVVPEARVANAGGIYTDQLIPRQMATSSSPDSFLYPSFASYPANMDVYGQSASYPPPQLLQQDMFQTMPHSTQYGDMPGHLPSQHHMNSLDQQKQTSSLADGQDIHPLYLSYAPIPSPYMPATHQSQYSLQQIQMDTNQNRHLPKPSQPTSHQPPPPPPPPPPPADPSSNTFR